MNPPQLPADIAVRRQAATALDTNVFLDAGAGCGKTQALTDRYLSLLESSVEVPEIVAVTFTNKASRDMKARLRQRCEERAREAEDQQQAAVWMHRARELENAPISTIHSFCTSLLRRYAIRAEIDPGFSVMDDIQQRLLLKQGVRETLLRRLDEEQDSAALVVSSLGLAAAREAIEYLISNRETCREDLLSPPAADQIAARWEGLGPKIAALRLELLVHSPAWQGTIAALHRHASNDPRDRLEQIRVALLRHAATAADLEADVQTRLAALQAILKLGSVPSKGSGWRSEEEIAEVAEAARNMKNSGRRPSQQIKDLVQPAEQDDTGAAALTAAFFEEAHHCLKAYEAAKSESSVLDYEDLQIMARDLLRRDRRVREDCRRRWRHLMVDEFQDTNGLQKELLWLAAGAEPQPGETPVSTPPPGRLFVVGDAKQSIYRFRQADVTVFNDTREEFAELAGCDRLRLSVTFRCLPTVAQVLNDMFSQPVLMGPDSSTRQPYEAFYEQLTAHRLDCGEGAACQVLLVEPGERALENGQASAERLRQGEALVIAEWIAQAVGSLTVFERTAESEVARPARPGDFALLFRATSDIALYERALRLHGLRYYVASGRGFFGRQEVRDLLNLLMALENRRDEIALAGVLRSPLFGLSDETIYWLKTPRGTLYELLQAAASEDNNHEAHTHISASERDLARFAAETLGELLELKNRLPLSSLVAEAVRRTGYTAALAGLFNGEQMISNVRKLMDLARDFESRGNYSLRDFVDYLKDLVVTEERMGEAPVEEEGADCVKLMTIHAAKGLEWPVVIVPDLGRGLRGSVSPGWVYHRQWGLVAAPRNPRGERQWPALATLVQELEEAEDEAERRRLLYVAATRCRDQLVLSASLSPRSGPNTWLEWLLEALRIDCQEPSCDFPNTNLQMTCLDALAPPVPGMRRRSMAVGATSPAVPGPDVMRRLQPIAFDPASLHRFTVTALSVYLRCPAGYRLRYLENLPEAGDFTAALPVTREGLSALQRGDVIHRVLQIVGSEGVAALPRALDLALAAQPATTAEREAMAETITWFLAGEVYRQKLQAATRLRSEMPLSFQLGEGLIEGKIDALAEHGGESIDVIDYKTGYETEGDTPAEHVFQLGLYCAGLALLGKTVRSATIIYLDSRRLREITPAEIRQAQEGAQQAVAGIRGGNFATARHEGCHDCRLRWACEVR